MALNHSQMGMSTEATMKMGSLMGKVNTTGQMEPITKDNFIKA
jgi:hypothetical protein